MSRTSKRIIWGTIGVVFAAIYGFWTMLSTGGGHINFIWLGLFIFVEFFGLYFPIMAVLAVDLRKRITKVVFGSLIGFNLIASTAMIRGWMTEPGEADRASDFARMLLVNGVGWMVVDAAVHFLPTMLFLFILVRSVLSGNPEKPAEDIVQLDL